MGLLERDMGPKLTAEDRAVAEAIAEGLDGQPLPMLQAAALVVELGYSLGELADKLESGMPTERLAELLFESLDEEQRAVLELLISLEGASLAADQLAERLTCPTQSRSWSRSCGSA